MSNMSIEPVAHKRFGATVRNVRLTELREFEFKKINAALLEYGFLIFPDQHLSNDQSRDFGQWFGELEFGGLPLSNQVRRKDGSYTDVVDFNSRLMRTNVGNETWHTDSTYMPISSKCALLSAVVLPAEGGETELADMRAAYTALDLATREQIKDLAAYHSTQFSQANDLGDFPETEAGTIYHGEAYLRPLVKIHPETGIPSLFIGRHAFGIPGLTRDESRNLLHDLLAFAVGDPERVYTHHWTVGDTLLWDNRALLHRARPYDYSLPRRLIGTRVKGENSELAYFPDDPAAAAGREALKAELRALALEQADKTYSQLDQPAESIRQWKGLRRADP